MLVSMQALGVAPGAGPWGEPAQLRPSCMRLGVAFVGSRNMLLTNATMLRNACCCLFVQQEGCSDGDLNVHYGTVYRD